MLRSTETEERNTARMPPRSHVNVAAATTVVTLVAIWLLATGVGNGGISVGQDTQSASPHRGSDGGVCEKVAVALLLPLDAAAAASVATAVTATFESALRAVGKAAHAVLLVCPDGAPVSTPFLQ